MKHSTFIVILILLIFFVISFLTNILGPLIPDIIVSFNLSIGLAGFLPFAFFVAYGIMSIPSGLLIEKYSQKKVLLWAFILACLGALLFGLFPSFLVAMLSLFLIGVGMAMLQVVINPLLREAGGEESFAFNSVLAQLFFGGASFLSPMMYSYLVKNVHSENRSFLVSLCNYLVPENLKWVSVYWIFFLITLIMVVIIKFIKFPTVELRDDERVEIGAAFKELLANKYVLLYFTGIFAYVGTEQGIANWVSTFLQTYHQVDPTTMGASVISYFWLLLTAGCILGLVLLKIFDSRKVLVIFSSGAIVSLAVGLWSGQEIALYAFPATGFFASVMWSVIVSLALNSVSHHHGTFSGILCTGIVGGAIIPLVIGGIAELVGLRYAMHFLFITLFYIFSIGLWAKPLVVNTTIKSFKDIFK
jgi:fucose permease